MEVMNMVYLVILVAAYLYVRQTRCKSCKGGKHCVHTPVTRASTPPPIPPQAMRRNVTTGNAHRSGI